MSIYDRPYMQQPSLRLNQYALFWIMSVTVGLYLLQTLVGLMMGTPLLEQYLAFSGNALLKGRIWTLLSYAGLHSSQDPFHLIFNMLMVFFVGRILNFEIGNRKLLAAYGLSAVCGALLFLLANPHALLLGASAAAFGLLSLYCLMHWDEEFTFLILFVIPIRTKPKYLFWGMLAIEIIMLMPELTGQRMVASSAHLGGIFGGFLFQRFLLHKNHWFESTPKAQAASRPVSKPAFRKKAAQSSSGKFSINLNNRTALRKEVDRILDKINQQGFGTLTKEEKQTLDRAKDILSK